MSSFNVIKRPALAATAFAAFSFAALTSSAPASAHHWHGIHGVGLSISLGGGYSRLHVGPSCRYYYRRWAATGYDYWWDRYEACRSGY